MALTIKQEKFAQAYIETGNASEAYRRAYDAENMTIASVNTEAWELLRHPEIARRVEELHAQLVRDHAVTVESITRELEEARALAIAVEQPGAAVSASTAKAKLAGLVVERSEQHVTTKVDKPALGDLMAGAGVTSNDNTRQDETAAPSAGTKTAQNASDRQESAA